MKITTHAFTPKDLFSYKNDSGQVPAQRSREEDGRAENDGRTAQARQAEKAQAGSRRIIDIYA